MTWPLTSGNVNSELIFLQRRNRILLSKLKKLVMKHLRRWAAFRAQSQKYKSKKERPNKHWVMPLPKFKHFNWSWRKKTALSQSFPLRKINSSRSYKILRMNCPSHKYFCSRPRKIKNNYKLHKMFSEAFRTFFTFLSSNTCNSLIKKFSSVKKYSGLSASLAHKFSALVILPNLASSIRTSLSFLEYHPTKLDSPSNTIPWTPTTSICILMIFPIWWSSPTYKLEPSSEE